MSTSCCMELRYYIFGIIPAIPVMINSEMPGERR
jgi:hypothetical protein